MSNRPQFFKTLTGQKLPLPIFFPDATRAFVKSLDTSDIESTKTPGVLVNTLHLYNHPGTSVIKKFDGVRNYMSWKGALISDSGGFQVMSLAKKFGGKNSVSNKGVSFKLPNTNKKILFTPQKSIQSQFNLKTDLIVLFDDFTEEKDNYTQARQTVDRTILWAKTCRKEFDSICQKQNLPPDKRPYLIGVAQGGKYLDLRRECTERLVEIGFDGIGWGGWSFDENGGADMQIAKIITDNTPQNYFLYGLGVGKPHEIVSCYKLGWQIFDCVLPSRDARHKRLYVYNAESIDDINISKPDFYSYYTPDKEKYYRDEKPVSPACDCLLCTHYSRSYLYHLFKMKDFTAGRLATIHNLRFYSILMEKIRQYDKNFSNH